MGHSSSLKKDFPSIVLLMFLYFLQWIPLGLIGSLPYILSARKVSYADQGTFSFAMWPFSLKLLWAPIVDSLFIRKLGRRKSWFVYETYSIKKQKANQYFDKLFKVGPCSIFDRHLHDIFLGLYTKYTRK